MAAAAPITSSEPREAAPPERAPAPAARALALDALRGLAILCMLLSGQLPFGHNALPAWMYHAQEPPPTHAWIATLPGITWVDLVFPTFLFSMGAAFPLALARRMDQSSSPWKLISFVLGRGFLLGFFALFVQDIRPTTISDHPTAATWLLGLLGFAILFPILTRLPSTWSRSAQIATRAVGWLGAILFCVFVTYPDGGGFKLQRSDIIIVVLTNMAVFGALVWMATRQQLLPRLGVMGLMLAIRLSNMPEPVPGWVHDIWTFSPAPWIYKLYYLQYLCVIIPGTIAGDLILQWTRAGGAVADPPRAGARFACVAALLGALVLDLLVSLESRWLIGGTLIAFALCLVIWKLLSAPKTATERLYKTLFQWASYWLVLGLFFEPYEGGIKKDHPTVSYYFVATGAAISVFLAFSILIDVFRKKRWPAILIDNGQNPMIAYAGINNWALPILALTGAETLLDKMAITPWLGFLKGLLITLFMAVTVSFLTRRKIFWRT